MLSLSRHSLTVATVANACFVNPLKGIGVNWLHLAIQV